MLLNNTSFEETVSRGSRAMEGPGDAVWILTSAFIIFTMISGFGLVESGMVSRKNEANIMVKNAIDVIFGGLGFWMFGFAFTFGKEEGGTNAFSGFGNFFTDADESEMGEVFSLYLFQASFATTATTIVSGAVAERMNLKAYTAFAFTNTITYCFPAHWVWGDKGWLKEMGVVDMGGASPVHLVGGVAGLVATLMLKPRTGRYILRSSKKEWNHIMASPTNVLLGMFMLWWGWLGFNCGSTFGVSGGKWKLASRSAVCTLNASCGGGVFVTIYSYILFNRLDIPLFMSGILGSLVSITAICGVVRPGESIIIGIIGAAVATIGWQILERFEVDDPVGAISIHAGGSIWGMIAVGMFVEPDRLEETFSNTYGAFKGGNVRILGIQVLACVVISVWTVVTVGIQFFVIDKLIGLRLSMEDELLGADDREHGITYEDIDLKEERPNCRSRMSRRNVVSPRVSLSTTDGRQMKTGNEDLTARRNTESFNVNTNSQRACHSKETAEPQNHDEATKNNHRVDVHKSQVELQDETEDDIEDQIMQVTVADKKSESVSRSSRSRLRSQSLALTARMRKPLVTITITPAE
ncbi:putative ammonium transporter 2 [Actinia tenebrosa]|uniref:Ammonium transporter n=1 Tax=Actinia tenebrosa TaxID=6105 RepID=A0A6P8HI20_ACTTE|nr:putative ammonium transporter 2 [Actinia tenebrosa]XP_031555512.1 putative ammonium transporter 2 [Actinia tenebrosa]